MATSTSLTIEDFEKLPDELAHNHELVDGALVDVSGITPKHNSLREWLSSLLFPFVEQRKLGTVIVEQEFDFGGNANGPDVSFISTSKLSLLDMDRRVQLFVPDLAIEIVSKNDKYYEIVKKAKRYREFGTKEVWVLSLETREAIRYSGEQSALLDENAVFASEQIPGFSIRLGELFDRV